MGPEFFEQFPVRVAHSRNIIQQGVKPHIGDIILVKWQGDAPFEAGFRTGYAEILKWFPQKSQHFVFIAFGTDEIRIFPNMINQPLLIIAHPEKIIGFPDNFRLCLMIRAFAVREFAICVKPLAPETVAPLIFAETDIA